MTKTLIALGVTLMLGGCSMAPDYQRPATPAGATWQASSDVTTTRGWKGTFSDPQLQQLITLALSNNRDLRIAALNVQSYEARYRIQRAAQLPTVGVDGSGSRQQTAGDINGSGREQIGSQYAANVGITAYELDFFGRIQSLKDQALEKLQSGPDKAIRSMDDSAVTRYDQYKTGSYVNTAMYMGTNSTSYYFSVANGNISRFFDEMYLNTPWDYHYSSLDGRSILDRLASVKYFAIKKSGYGYLPYGYDSEAEVTKKYRIYEDEDSLPLGYTYDSWIPREKYEKLSVTEKQQALLQGAVLEDSSLPETDLTFDDKKADFTLEAGKGCKIKDGKIIVAKEGATVQIGYQGEPEAEVYLVAKNLDFNAYSPRAVVSDKKWDSMTEYEKNTVRYEDNNWRYWKESKESAVDVSLGSVDKTIRIFTDKYNGYSGRHNFLLNMGYKNYSAGTMTLTFSMPGEYTFDDLYVVCQPMASVEEQTEELGKESLQNIKTETNCIRGDITTTSDKILVFSIPYSAGFTAYVDGEKTELVQANSMYMGLELKKGRHTITLRYCTPYIVPGMILTVLGLILFAGIVISYRRQRKQKERGKQEK